MSTDFGYEGVETTQREEVKLRLKEMLEESSTSSSSWAGGNRRLLSEVERIFGVGEAEAMRILEDVWDEYVQDAQRGQLG